MTELIPFDLSYGNELFKLTIKNKDYLKKWLPWLDSIKSEKDTIEFLQKSIMTDYAGTSLNYFITYSGRIIGTIGLRELSQEKGLVGYWIDKNYQGKNIVTESLLKLIKDIRDNQITNLIILRCSPANMASLCVANKCGFKYKKTLKNAENLYGRFNDLDIYEYNI